MTQRISDADLVTALDSMWGDRASRGTLKWQLAADLRDCRAEVSRLSGEVERLKALSESQAQALDMIEAGRL
jgi:hypothetical protein